MHEMHDKGCPKDVENLDRKDVNQHCILAMLAQARGAHPSGATTPS